MTKKIKKVLSCVIDSDIGEMTILEYLRELLSAVWEQAEGFSGKRPFGNGAWQYDVYSKLIKEGLVDGELDKDGYVNNCDTKKADQLIQEAIKAIFDCVK